MVWQGQEDKEVCGGKAVAEPERYQAVGLLYPVPLVCADTRPCRKENQLKQKKKEEVEKEKAVRRIPQVASSLFLQHNDALVPPYRVLIDTNFINFSLQNKLELISGMMDCLYAKCIPCVTDCVMAELEKLGHRYRVALRLIFAPTDKVDLVWSTIANSLISGPLASTSAHCAKVATCPKHEVPNYSHVLCLYVPNVYDKEDVTEIMKILLRKHGMNLMGVKSNLYTAIGLDSKHPSGIPSTVWKNSALMPETDIKKLKEEYFAELAAAKNNDTEKTAARKAAAGTVAKSKPKLKRKAENDDPFASEDDEPKDTKSEAKSKSQAGGASTSQKTAKAAPKTKKELSEGRVRLR
ncbi:hypothetical protein EVJ58_g1967 [Rhodofomes roseus]|uniref:PIN domain-containing protein n=1 Tax=Rhodofomes roseus TaxID=34475 RepID=A0A4Y9YSP4_9APHY|nr:hypothetical protein EVJ58_g1967 [Rhodofomes roseus]